MKIGIITITDGSNYGNRLQNYALQEFLRSIGVEVETVRRYTDRDLSKSTVIKAVIKDVIKTVIGKKNTFFYQRKRKKIFKRFNKEYVSFSKMYTRDNAVFLYNKNEYDYIVCGSDQIWNTKFDVVKCDLSNYLACFSENKIAFAASFGTTEIDEDYKNIFELELQKFKGIAMREESGKKIVNSLLGSEKAIEVLDPTLLLNREKWEKIEKRPRYLVGDKFLVTYFLGGRTEKINSYINDYANLYGLNIVNLDIEFLADNEINNKSTFITSPEEFIWLIHNSEIVLTDSFHASAFSIIFEKQFLVFEREAKEKGNKMGGRIDNLLEKFQLLEYKATLDRPVDKFPKIDYTSKEKVLDAERKKAKEFLLNILEEDSQGLF